MNIKARAICALVGASSVAVGFWLSGVPIVRGDNLVVAYVTCLVLAAIGFACPLFDKD